MGDEEAAASERDGNPLCTILAGVGVLVPRSEESDHSLVVLDASSCDASSCAYGHQRAERNSLNTSGLTARLCGGLSP